ncbi:hypothetical protein [Piscirickettsia salmonis]|uniref:hypothetical protein n=2 Tax=Piscirickettsia salmonis TaxID=1238 RepID=UPI001E3EFFC7|nr:hypothetical protein [Piscirickettsia salmonis]QGP56859.1 hypothetical protein PsalSR1_04348 [Piscirickettsia salmonis]
MMYSVIKSFWAYGVGGVLVIVIIFVWRYEMRQSAQHELRHEIAQTNWKHNTETFYLEQQRLKQIQQRYFTEVAATDEEHDDVDHALLESLHASKNWSATDIPNAIFIKLCQAELVDRAQAHRCKSAVQFTQSLQNNQDPGANQ